MALERRPLPLAPDVLAPDGSEVRVLLRLGGASMAHFRLAEGEVSAAVRHRSVEELWYVVGGRGRMWRRLGGEEDVADLEAGLCLAVPVGASFQFRSLGPGPLDVLGVTTPAWPGDGEAVAVDGPWRPTVPPGPGLHVSA